ncbi:MAG: hypothetical protein ACI8WB_004443, partial [Phenylobacterium sp.]
DTFSSTASRAAKTVFREHPTLLFTFCYFIITVIGVVYYSYFYREFGINIIKFADLSDFLLAAVLEPRSLMIFIGLVVVIAALFRIDLFLRKKLRARGWYIRTKLTNKYADPLVLIFALVFTTDVWVSSLASDNAKEVKSGIIDEYIVRIADQPTPRSLALLGSSSRFVYLYDVKKAQPMVVPVESVSYMRKVLPVVASIEEKVVPKAAVK